jgi:hypothetical protein
MKKHELFIHLSLPKAQKRPIVMVHMYTDDLIVVPEHDTGTIKLRARCFSCPGLTGEAMIGKPDRERHYHQRVYPPLSHSPTMRLAEQ